MKRGDIITVAVNGDYGKPRPALVVQSDLLSHTDSVLVCLITSTIRNAPLHRLPIPVGETTGLRQPSQVMADKIMAVKRDRCGAVIGCAGHAVMLALGQQLAFIVGVAD